MAHPFFDATKYPWHLTPEADDLHRELYDNIRDPAEIDRRYHACAENLLPLALNVGPSVIWEEALNRLGARPGALQKLCEQNYIYPKLIAAIERVRNAVARLSQPITKDNEPILDRSKLREKIEVLSVDTAALKVLLVRGGTQSGKSYGRHLLHAAAYDRGAIPVYITSGMVGDVKDVVGNLFAVYGASREVPVFTTDNAGYRVICNKLLELARTQEKQMWIAVDDLGLDADGTPLLSQDIKLFFDQFALRLADPSFATWFRLMLIHYPDGKPPTKWMKEVYTLDSTSEDDVQQEHVEEALRAWSSAHGLSIVDQELSDLATDVIENAEAPPAPGEEDEGESRLQRINNELKKTFDRLAKQKK